jgi:hypothetical protein
LRGFRLLPLCLVAATAVHADPAQLTSAALGLWGFSTTGGIIHANYPGHPSVPVRIDLYVNENGQWVFNDRCQLNGMVQTGPYPPGMAWCPFAFPRAPGPCQIKLRVWKITPDGQYANAWDDHVLNAKLSDDTVYPMILRSRLVTVDKPAYRARIDPWGGTTYEFYSKRAGTGLPAGEYLNSTHTHPGAALQIALHAGKRNCLFVTAGQGYYNPTQAGASCAFHDGKVEHIDSAPSPDDPASGLTITCDGTANNHPANFQNILALSLHRMMNWDYGQGYDGPYNPGDQTYLSEKVTAYDDYLQYDLQMENQNARFPAGLNETPTYYFSNEFRRFYVPANGAVQPSDLPYNISGDDSKRPEKKITNDEEHWISFENTGPGVSHYFVTIAWFYSPEFVSPHSHDLLQVSETEVYHQIKMTNVHLAAFQPGKLYRFGYVIFPYRYDEMVSSKFGKLSVRDTIQRMGAAFSPVNAAAAAK